MTDGTFVLSCTVSEIWQLNGRKSLICISPIDLIAFR